MNVNEFLAAAFASSLDTLGAERVLVDGHAIEAVVSPLEDTQDLVLGGDGDHRALSVAFPSASLPFEPEANHPVQARGDDWIVETAQIHPQTTTVLTLVSPQRRS